MNRNCRRVPSSLVKEKKIKLLIFKIWPGGGRACQTREELFSCVLLGYLKSTTYIDVRVTEETHYEFIQLSMYGYLGKIS
jgi:hypothetical protein